MHAQVAGGERQKHACIFCKVGPWHSRSTSWYMSRILRVSLRPPLSLGYTPGIAWASSWYTPVIPTVSPRTPPPQGPIIFGVDLPMVASNTTEPPRGIPLPDHLASGGQPPGGSSEDPPISSGFPTENPLERALEDPAEPPRRFPGESPRGTRSHRASPAR